MLYTNYVSQEDGGGPSSLCTGPWGHERPMKFKRMKTLRGILHDTKCEVSLDDLGLFNQ